MEKRRRQGSRLRTWALVLGAMAGSGAAASAGNAYVPSGPTSPYRLRIDSSSYRLQQDPHWRLPPPRLDNPVLEGRPFAEAIRTAATRAGVEEEFLHAVVKIESAYRPRAVSPKGARGLAQLMPATAERFGTVASTEPVENLLAGARYLRLLLDAFGGDKALAAAAYNAGEGAVRRHGGIPPYAETRAYVPRVLAEYAVLKRAERIVPAPWQLVPAPAGEALAVPQERVAEVQE